MNDNTYIEDKNNKSITLVCCYNDKKQYKQLCDSINTQRGIEIIKIGIENINNHFNSCACAYNSIIEKIQTDYVVYLHQDIRLLTPDTLLKFHDVLKGKEKKDIVGVGGKIKQKKGVYTNVVLNDKGEFAGDNRVNGTIECETIDECFFGGNTDFFRQNPFDTITCNSWHLYAVDRCLDTRLKGGKVYVTDLKLEHLSLGNIDKTYAKAFLKLGKKYSGKYRKIYTTCIDGYTGPILRYFTYFKTLYGKKIKMISD